MRKNLLTDHKTKRYNHDMQSSLFDNIDALLITNPTNIRYLTGFVGVDKRDAYILITAKQTFLFTNSLYREQAKKTKAEFVEISRENPISKELAKVFTGKKLGFEETDLTVAELRKLKETLTGVKLIPTQNRIEALRMIKRKDEIENIRLAANITDQCFSYITKRIRPGVTEARLAWEIESFFRKNGAEKAFSPVVAFGTHSSQPHYLASQGGPLRNRDIVLLDFGAKVHGYCADMTRVVFVGKPKPEWIKTYNLVLTANKKAVDLLKNGERDGGVLDKKANIPPYPHSLGHAVGLDIHEAPRLTHKKPEMLKPGMVVTVEPGVYIEGSYGVRLEDLVLLKENSIEVLSKSPKEAMIL